MNNNYLDNQWLTVRMKVRLKPRSVDLWMEFTSFRRMITWQMHNDLNKAPSSPIARTWLYTQMGNIEDIVKKQIHCHKFLFPPPVSWLSDYLPKLNQSVLLATAVPPVVSDMSTAAHRQFRLPFKWASFVHSRLTVEVSLNPLPNSQPTQDDSRNEQ